MRFVFVICFLLVPRLFARQVPIVLLHTCDLHGNILPTENYEGKTNLGGLARCATVIRQIRQQEKKCLLVDAGDTIQGAAISYLTNGRVMVKALNLLRYDAWCWGNHEFDWGLDKLAICGEQAQMPILNANVVRGSDDSAARVLACIKPYRIVEVDGVKIGLIGLNTPGVPNWSRPQLIHGLKFADSVETLKTIIPAVQRAGAKVLVLVCHQGYREGGDDHANQINAIAQTFPELDVIIGGHTHRNFPEFKVNNVLYSQADYFGIHLGRVDLTFDTEAGRVTHRESKTIVMDEQVPLDQELLKACGQEIDQAQKVSETILGEAKGDFDVRGAPRRESPVHNLICESIAEALRARSVRVDAVVHGIFERRGLVKGAITIGDVWKVVPYENYIGVLQLIPDQLREVLEENAATYEKREFRGIWGLRWRFDPVSVASNRTTSLTGPDGSDLPENGRLAVAFNSYELASGGLRWNRLRELAELPETKLTEYDVQTRQAVIDYIRHHREVVPAIKGWWQAALPR